MPRGAIMTLEPEIESGNRAEVEWRGELIAKPKPQEPTDASDDHMVRKPTLLGFWPCRRLRRLRIRQLSKGTAQVATEPGV